MAEPPSQTAPRKLILHNRQAPGDTVMLTAAVRDLHAAFPGRYLTDVRTPSPALWEHNPHVTPLRDDDPEAERIDCQYPLIHGSNQRPYHFIHGFLEHLGEQLGVRIAPGVFRGDIHLAPEEKRWMSQVQEMTREPVPFWIIVAGGKRDYTIKWWDVARWQQVVEALRGRILFVQVGAKNHEHPALEGVLDLRGRTSLRQLVRLVYHAQGVVCPVTSLMHLAAAVEVRGGEPKHRPCVVVAGGREPPHWEAYPHHQYIHTVGALPCCAHGGCWRSRTVPLGDGDKKDQNLCVDALPADLEARSSADAATPRSGPLPHCMDMITAEEVVRRIELYFAGGNVRYLDAAQARRADAVLRRSDPRQSVSLPTLLV